MRLVRSRNASSSVLDAVGNTPLLRLERVARSAPGVEVYVKLEFANPGGSVKDRPALRMMQDAIADGRLTRDKILIDSTSGNTGVAYSLFGAALGVRVQLVMPTNVTQGAQGHRAGLRHRAHLQRSDGGLRRRDPPRARDRREEPGEVLLPRPVLEPVEPARALPRHRRARSSTRSAIASRTSSPASARAAR